jgi:hypothetical protein
MVISARLPAGAALIPRIGRRDRDRGSCGPTPPPYVWVRIRRACPASTGPISSPVTTPRLNQTLPDLQTAQTLPDLIGRTAPNVALGAKRELLWGDRFCFDGFDRIRFKRSGTAYVCDVSERHCTVRGRDGRVGTAVSFAMLTPTGGGAWADGEDNLRKSKMIPPGEP